MPLDFFLVSTPQTDSLRPGTGAVRTDRSGASQLQRQRADGEGTGSFDKALDSARAQHETAGPALSDGREVDASATPAVNAQQNRPDCSASEYRPAGGTAQAPRLSDAESIATALSTDEEPSAGDVSTGVAPVSDSTTENTATPPVTASYPSCVGDLFKGGLALDAAESTPASTGTPEPSTVAASRREDAQPAVDLADTGEDTGEETTVFRGTDTERVGLQPANAKTEASAKMVSATAADVATDATVKTDASRSENNRHQNRVENTAGGSTEKSWTLSPSSFGRSDPPSTAGVGGFSSDINKSPFGDDLAHKFGNGADRDLEATRSGPPASEKGAEKPLWSTDALKTDGDGYRQGTGVTAVKTGTEPEQKGADMLLALQRTVTGAGEATAAAEAGETHHPKDLRAETLSQIVDKAVFRLRSGQSEVRLDLKPDSLGHVRLQIVTESHQVSLRIMAESHAAKHLIDSGIGQLKADLQAQGLRVDEIEVSVAGEFDDFNRHSAFSDRAAQARRTAVTGRSYFEETVPATVVTSALENRSADGVDCFV